MRLTVILFVVFALLCLAAAEPSSEVAQSLVARKEHGKKHHKHKGKKHKHKKHHKHKHHKSKLSKDALAVRHSCAFKNPDALKAIDKLCKKHKKIKVPSAYALGAKSQGKTYAKIGRGCDPATHVGWKDCRENFYKVCAMGGGGYGTFRYGPQNGCQRFHVGKFGDNWE